MGTSDPIAGPIVLFDGVCNLCNGSVQFIIKHDPKKKFSFAALQSEFGRLQLSKQGISNESPESMVLLKDNKYYQKSNAVLEIARMLGGLWPVFFLFKIIPTFIRDWIYKWIAANRYRWFGKKDQCMIPTPELKSRFLD